MSASSYRTDAAWAVSQPSLIGPPASALRKVRLKLHWLKPLHQSIEVNLHTLLRLEQKGKLLFLILKLTLPKKTKFIKCPFSAFFAPQLQQNLAAIIADLEAGNSKFVAHA